MLEVQEKAEVTYRNRNDDDELPTATITTKISLGTSSKSFQPMPKTVVVTSRGKRSINDLPESVPTTEGKTTEEYLVALSTFLIEYPSPQKIDSLWPLLRRYCVKNFKVYPGLPEYNLLAHNLDEHMTNLAALVKTSPNYRIEVDNAVAQADEPLSRAVVFLTTKAGGIFGVEAMVRESVCAAYWRRHSRNHWMLVRLEILRGPGHMTFATMR